MSFKSNFWTGAKNTAQWTIPAVTTSGIISWCTFTATGIGSYATGYQDGFKHAQTQVNQTLSNDYACVEATIAGYMMSFVAWGGGTLLLDVAIPALGGLAYATYKKIRPENTDGNTEDTMPLKLGT
jgi:hypothetical protein